VPIMFVHTSDVALTRDNTNVTHVCQSSVRWGENLRQLQSDVLIIQVQERRIRICHTQTIRNLTGGGLGQPTDDIVPAGRDRCEAPHFEERRPV
jgi:hypothetical protein